jgi:hypothetical protein
MFSALLNGLLMLDEGRFEKSGMVLDCALSLAFKANVSKWEPTFFFFLLLPHFLLLDT